MTETTSERIARETGIDQEVVDTVVRAMPATGLIVDETALNEAMRLQDGKRAGTPHDYVRGVLDALGIAVDEESMSLPDKAGAKFLAHPRGNKRHADERVFVIAGGQCIDVDSGERWSPGHFEGVDSRWVVTTVIDRG